MTAWVCARCEAMVTSDRRIPTTPTRIPTRRVLGSAVCSGLTSISGMRQLSLIFNENGGRPRRRLRGPLHASRSARSFDDVQTWIGACDTQDAAADDFDDFAESGDVGDEFADLGFGAGQLHDVARG